LKVEPPLGTDCVRLEGPFYNIKTGSTVASNQKSNMWNRILGHKHTLGYSMAPLTTPKDNTMANSNMAYQNSPKIML